MTLTTRVIPVLLWDTFGAVKPLQFSRPGRRAGSMFDYVRVYERRQIDELVILDIDAANHGGPRFNDIKEFTSQLFCPLTIGGGVRSLKDVEKLFRSGADKVAICTATTDAGFIGEASRRFGAQSVVGCIDVRGDGNVVFENGTDPYFKDCMTPAQWARILEDRGVGEIILTSVIKDGTLQGYDLDLIRGVTAAVACPVVANGGCGHPSHMVEAIKAGAHATAAGSMFLFTEVTPADCADHLALHGVPVRRNTPAFAIG